MENMKKNYLSKEDITEVLKKEMVEYYLDFNAIDDFEFTKWEGCDGLLLGHQEVKWPVKEGVRYTPDVVKSFKNWLKRIPGFSEQLKVRQPNKENMRASAIGEYVKLVLERVQKRRIQQGDYTVVKAKITPIVVRTEVW